jgi:metal-dependent hydrolase (beta-lactamase superfamily II)
VEDPEDIYLKREQQQHQQQMQHQEREHQHVLQVSQKQQRQEVEEPKHKQKREPEQEPQLQQQEQEQEQEQEQASLKNVTVSLNSCVSGEQHLQSPDAWVGATAQGKRDNSEENQVTKLERICGIVVVTDISHSDAF